jgi:acyl-[acyl-carrier-protein]-phospholipid O-acyltransferase/long-chain-fatty-acid--[acyl-carrier-protein] ligase
MAGAGELVAACRRASVRTLYTSRRYVQAAHLEALVGSLEAGVEVQYLEDVRDRLTSYDWLAGYVSSVLPWLARRAVGRNVSADSPAVVLFVPGPGGALLETEYTHASLLAGCQQLAARIPLGSNELLLSVLPPADPLGLLTGTLLPLVSGARVFFYPAARHYRMVPEMAYGLNATMLFAADALLERYARHAHPYDFQSLRYVFAEARGLRESTRHVWAEKYGLRLFEVYGQGRVAPVLAVNSPVDYRAGTVGRLMPGLERRLTLPVGEGGHGQLSVRGPSLSTAGIGHERWSDTGDLVAIDAEGYLRLMARLT